VIPNGRRPRSRQATKEPLVLAAGRVWDEAKNLRALERIAPSLPWPVVLVGDGSRIGRVRDAQVADAMSRASIFALPAYYEPFGLSALEAALAGCALVLGEIPSLREVWAQAAVFVDPADNGALFAALNRLIGDGELRARYAAAARERAALYSVDAMADRYVEAYKRVLASEPLALERV
jgi:glycosyltransferase involved in cell wall biosynthesis